MTYEEKVTFALDWRGVQHPCKKCGGRGTFCYGSTSVWRGGAGGSAMTTAQCNVCWGSGEEGNPWPNMREIERKLRG